MFINNPLITVPDEDEGPPDDIRLYESGWKDRYYRAKFDVGSDDMEFRHRVAWAYVEGLCWVLRYYYQGCASWDWYFPYHYAPFASDFETVGEFVPDFSRKTKPFNPLEQLMSVFPAASKQHLPDEWQKLMIEDSSPIIDLYPADFRIDLNGKKYAWQGVALLPFVDELRLLKTLESVYPTLSDEEKQRNTRGPNRIFIGRNHPSFEFFKTISESEAVEMVDLDPTLLNGVSGKISADATAVAPGLPFVSPVNHEDCQDLPTNCGICVLYEDPEYPEDFIFPATRLSGAKEMEKTLRPEDWNDRRDGRFQPQIGFNRNAPRAGLDHSAQRHVNHHVRGAMNDRNEAGYNSRGGGHGGYDDRRYQQDFGRDYGRRDGGGPQRYHDQRSGGGHYQQNHHQGGGNYRQNDGYQQDYQQRRDGYQGGHSRGGPPGYSRPPYQGGRDGRGSSRYQGNSSWR
uniref:XRN_M domain-containing protein n=1 Tax=Caenorhabditis japonica TaxID=281687 RepID=A0A8R1I1F0_CAEJA